MIKHSFVKLFFLLSVGIYISCTTWISLHVFNRCQRHLCSDDSDDIHHENGVQVAFWKTKHWCYHNKDREDQHHRLRPRSRQSQKLGTYTKANTKKMATAATATTMSISSATVSANIKTMMGGMRGESSFSANNSTSQNSQNGRFGPSPAGARYSPVRPSKLAAPRGRPNTA